MFSKDGHSYLFTALRKPLDPFVVHRSEVRRIGVYLLAFHWVRRRASKAAIGLA